jgi:ABC-type glycerol-3-phosphate transport system substrate-binding protein
LSAGPWYVAVAGDDAPPSKNLSAGSTIFRMPELPALLWLCLAAYGIHVLEEFVFNWQSWARNVLHLPARWEDFYVTNALVVVLKASKNQAAAEAFLKWLTSAAVQESLPKFGLDAAE